MPEIQASVQVAPAKDGGFAAPVGSLIEPDGARNSLALVEFSHFTGTID
jgi:hypothetical protein